MRSRSLFLAPAFLLLVLLATVSPAAAQQVVLGNVPPPIADGIHRALAGTTGRALVVNGDLDPPAKLAAGFKAEFVILHDAGGLALWDAGGGTVRHRAILETDHAAVAGFAEEVKAWMGVEAMTPDRTAATASTLDLGAARPPSAARSIETPTYRIELATGVRGNIAGSNEAEVTAALALLRRVGRFELGPSFEGLQDRYSWKQSNVTAQLRYPIDGVLPGRYSIVPRIGGGVVFAQAHGYLPGTTTDIDDRATAPIADAGVMIEHRWHRVALGFDAGGSIPLALTFRDGAKEVVVPAHLESLVRLRVSLLLY